MHRPTSLLLFPFLLVGCSDDAPAPDKVRARIASDLVTVIDQAQASTADGKVLPDASAFALLENAIDVPLGDVLESEDVSLFAPRVRSMFAPEDTEEDEFDGAEAAQWLNENIFTDANHAGDGIYKVPASLVCTDEQFDDNGNSLGEQLDAECAEAFDKIQLRIRVFEADSALHFALQLGPKHDEPLEVGLSSKLLSLTVDLDEAESAAHELAPKLGESLPNFQLDGRITAKLEVPGANTARVSLDIERAIAVKFAEHGESLDGPNATRFSTGASEVFSLSLDGNALSMEAAIALAATAAHIPDEFEGPTELALPGLTGTATYKDGQPLVLSNIGLGASTTTLKIDGKTAMAFDLNPNDGRKFDATLSGNLLEVSPRLDFRTQVDHLVLGDEAPIYDVTRILLDGGLRGRADETLEVTGSFSIETNPAQYGFAATAGQCVSGAEVYDSTRGEYYTQFAVGACN
jgi:hypothetical protein